MVQILEVIDMKSVLARELCCDVEKIEETVMVVPSDAKEFDKIHQAIKCGLTRKRFSPNTMRKITMCVDEAFSNSIKWGNNQNIHKKVTVKFYIGRKIFAGYIEDQGRGFDAGKISKDIESEAFQQSNSRGIFLINRLMDKIIYNKEGNTILMLKYNN